MTDIEHAVCQDILQRQQIGIAFVKDDGAAMSFQTMAQYRLALLRILGGTENAGVRCDMATGPCACGAWHGDEADGIPIGWTIVATGDDGSVLCRAPNGRRARFWFDGNKLKNASEEKTEIVIEEIQ